MRYVLGVSLERFIPAFLNAGVLETEYQTTGVHLINSVLTDLGYSVFNGASSCFLISATPKLQLVKYQMTDVLTHSLNGIPTSSTVTVGVHYNTPNLFTLIFNF